MARDREMDFWYHAMVVLVSRDLILEKCHLFHTSRIGYRREQMHITKLPLIRAPVRTPRNGLLMDLRT